MKDFIGRELEIGDLVAMPRPRYAGMVLGKIVKFTPKMVRVEYTNHYSGTASHACSSKDVVKLDSPEATLFFLKKNG